MNSLVLSPLNHTWIIDLDGTILKHNGYLIDGYDSFLPGACDFLNSIPDDDMIIFLTSRLLEYKETTEEFLKKNGIKYHTIIFCAPYGERVLINDKKPSGLVTGISVNTERDKWDYIEIVIDQNK